MFTGIVTAKGRIRAISGQNVRRFEIEAPYDADTIALGASIAHAGACLTVVDKGASGEGCWFAVEISPETLRLTTLGGWREGDPVNLERALAMGEELGGHLVTGHVDGVGELVERRDEGEWIVLTVRPPAELNRFIARKGSITVDGVSLTVNDVTADSFDLMIIPHTAEVTTLGALQIGAHVNLEVDLMARYAARLSEFSPA
ncbi:riboflavin synthase subunit alpha [Maricaulis sp. W15]|uniref:riboflavin synthase n=1 Tax=Maricaulis sp. W15 TaxID=1772333 RepID=UPI000948E9B4|nr:riboflavin synthase [Maricaulis sp. W15]OLF78037.1 riboflavin synthase subunit alpha [Maricaulis sp. W15]